MGAVTGLNSWDCQRLVRSKLTGRPLIDWRALAARLRHALKIAPEGWVVIIPFCAACLILGGGGLLLSLWAGVLVLGLLAMVVALLFMGWALWFFRDPARVTPPGQDQVISPADGKVIKVDMAPMPVQLREPGAAAVPMQRIAIFLNVFNVHVNRVPAAGKITKVVYSPGKFFNASMDKASELNERSVALLTDPRGRQIAFAQIAGWVARRIVNHLREGQTVQAGERFGLIRFGSRAEIYLPAETEILVQVGDRVVAGETLMAKLALPVAAAATPTRGVVEPVMKGAAVTSAVDAAGGAGL